MSAAGFTPIQLYRSTTASAVPTSGNLADGELAINTNDGKLYYKDSGGTVQLIASKAGASGDVVGPASATDNAVVRFDGTTGKLVQNSVVTIADTTGNISGVGQLNATTVDTTNLEVTNIKAIDGTAAASIANSTGVVSITANPVLSGGTANGVAYLNSSKVLTTGSALTFDGSAFSTTGTINAGTAAKAYKVANWTLAGYSGNTLQFGNATTAGEWTDMAWYIASSEQMRLTSTGLGIGTSSPKIQEWRAGTYLTVANVSTRGQVEIDGAVADSGSASLGALIFTYSTNTTNHKDVALIEAISSGATANQRGGVLNFYTKANGTASPALNMTLDSSGNLGLGVTPSAWSTSYKAISVGYVGGQQMAGGTGNSQALWTANLVFTGTGATGWKLPDNVAGTSYEQYLGAHKWYNAPANGVNGDATLTQAMTLDASGNLGVGVTAPDRRLHVGSTLFPQLRLVYPGVQTYDIGVTSGGLLSMGVAGTNAVNIDSSGNLLVGTTSAVAIAGRNSKVNVVQSADGVWAGGFVHSTSTGAQAFGVAINYSASAPNSTQNPFLYCEDNTALRAEIRSNGGLANYSGNNANLSDRREKTNFAPAGKYLSKICAIPVQTFNYIDQNMEDDPGLTLGVVAQDVQAVAPELVSESNWGTEDNPKMRLSIYQTDFQYALMKCIQEQQAIIESLTTRVAQLEGA